MSRIQQILHCALLVTACSALLAFELPAGWIRSGSAADKYDMGIDPGSGPNGNNAATIKSRKKKIDGFGTLMQLVPSGDYAGKRVRLSGYVKSTDVTDWAGLWMRVDRKGVKGSLAFDNMKERPIQGTTDRTRYDVVLDVPGTATGIAFGALLAGTGQVWFDDLAFEIVDTTVAVTGRGLAAPPTGPTNLDLEK